MGLQRQGVRVKYYNAPNSWRYGTPAVGDQNKVATELKEFISLGNWKRGCRPSKLLQLSDTGIAHPKEPFVWVPVVVQGQSEGVEKHAQDKLRAQENYKTRRAHDYKSVLGKKRQEEVKSNLRLS